MKIHAAVMASGLLGAANANYEKITSVLSKLEFAAYNQSVASGAIVAGDRGFVPQFMQHLEEIKHYGCWCYLDEGFENAKGPVQDGIDQVCKRLVQGYRCLVLDALERGETCDPVNQQYDEYSLFGGSGDIIADCTQDNTDQNGPAETAQCRRDLCIVDGTFSLDLFSLIFQVVGGIEASAQYDANLAHATNAQNPGLFDPEQDCFHQQQGNGRSEKECCGDYPDRFSYKTFDGERACCGVKTYSTLTYSCQDPSTSTLAEL